MTTSPPATPTGPLVLSGVPPAFEAQARDALRAARSSIAERLGAIAPRAGLRGALSSGTPLAVGGCTVVPHAFLDRDRWPDVFLLLGTAAAGARPSVLTRDVETPLGKVSVDRRVARQIAARARPRPALDGEALLDEPSWQHELLLLQVVARELDRSLRVVPIIAGPAPHRTARRLGRVLAEVLFAQRKRGCLIVTGALPRLEPPVLDAIAARRGEALEAIGPRRRELTGVDGAARAVPSPVWTLIEFAQTDGLVLDHDILVPGGVARASVSIAFTLGRPVVPQGAAATQALRVCDHTLLLEPRGRSKARLLHLCDHRAHALGGGASEVILELLRGADSIDHLARRLSARWGAEVTSHDVAALVDAFTRAGLLHPHEPPAATPSRFQRARAAAVLARARVDVPFYQALASPALDAAPFVFAADVRARWHELFRADVTWRGPTPAARRRFYLRASSASSGANRVRTVVEADVMRERRLDWALVAERPEGSVVGINRPANFAMPDDARRWPRTRRSGAALRISPGPNPSEVSPATWDRTLDAVLAADPARITGDPAYVAGLARCALRHGVRFASLEAVEMSHSFAWEIYQDVARRAFGIPVGLDYDASEVGPIAATCPDGRLHLLEAHMMYELFDRGAPVIDDGALGALVVTTLDTSLRPLIRYVLGDVVRLCASACRCGRPFRVIEVEGRVRNLLTGPDGQPVTLRTIDRAIGAPPGVDFFRVTVRDRGTPTLDIVPSARDLVDAALLADAIGACLGRSVRLRWRTSLPVPPGGKLLSVETDDASDTWYRRFLGTAPPRSRRTRR